VSRGRIALLCAVAGLTVVGAGALVDAIATGFYNCYPDPYFPEPCMAQEWAYFGILVACWLVATYLFACAFMGLMLWCGILAWSIVSTLVIEALQNGDYFTFHGVWEVALIGVPPAMAVIGLLTAGVGHVMQVSIQKRRRKRLPHPA